MENNEANNRIAEALKIRGIKRADLAKKTGICSSTISNWANQKYQPKHKSLYILAQALNVNEMWLAGYDMPMERSPERVKLDTLARSINIVRKDERLTNIVINLIDLTEEQRAVIESTVLVMKSSNQSTQGEQ